MNKQVLKFAAGITYYNPDDACLNRLERYLNIFDMVFIYDNSEDNSKYIEYIRNKSRVCYMTAHRNDGLPKAFNQILDKCRGLCDYLCMLDQDSEFANSEINKMMQFITISDSKDIGIFAPKIIYSHENIRSRVERESSSYLEANWVIASGSFIRIKSVFQAGIHFDEAYFIDRFDVDFCRQLRSKNLKIIIYNKAKLFQQLGSTGRWHHSQHAPFRHYYIFRNRLYYNRKFYSLDKRCIISFLQSLRHIFYILAYEDEKIPKIKYCFQGMYDYIEGNMGCKNK